MKYAYISRRHKVVIVALFLTCIVVIGLAVHHVCKSPTYSLWSPAPATASTQLLLTSGKTTSVLDLEHIYSRVKNLESNLNDLELQLQQDMKSSILAMKDFISHINTSSKDTYTKIAILENSSTVLGNLVQELGLKLASLKGETVDIKSILQDLQMRMTNLEMHTINPILGVDYNRIL